MQEPMGPTREFFFAGDPIASDVANSGVGGLWAMVAPPWQRVVTWADGWLTIEPARGTSGMENAYRAALTGEIDPSAGSRYRQSPVIATAPGE
jgi:hypothetical protein